MQITVKKQSQTTHYKSVIHLTQRFIFANLIFKEQK